MAEQPADPKVAGAGPARGIRLLLAGAGLGALLGLGMGWSVGHGPLGAPVEAPGSCASSGTSLPRPGASATPGDPGEAALVGELADARRLMDLRAWLTPADGNVRAVLAELRQRWPNDARVAQIQREAAERALADAVGLEVARKNELGAGRVRLALEWEPDLPGARDVLKRLERGPAPVSSDGLELGPLPTRSPPLRPDPLAPAPAPSQDGP
jgi:hypothetical protein